MRSAILLSGGIDSAAIAFMRRPEVAITIDYGQKPFEGELRAASTIASLLGMEHHTISVDCSSLGSGDLAGKQASSLAPESEWWPFRNQLLVTLAAMRCVSLNVSSILVGSVKSDGFHKDGTSAFYESINLLISMQEGAIKVLAPAIDILPIDLVRASGIPPSMLAWTHSCHKANRACGNCRGCYKNIEILDVFLNIQDV